MKKGLIIVFFIVCFVLGTLYGSSGTSTSTLKTSAQTELTQHINQYEQLVSQGEEMKLAYSELVSEGVVPKAPTIQTQGVAHNNISKLGQDAGDVLKVTVRELLRLIVRACDQLITE